MSEGKQKKKTATQKKPATRGKGRPTRYKSEYAEMAYKLCILGYTNEKLADFFKVSLQTITNWMNAHKDFLGAVMNGRVHADAKVADSLYDRANGSVVWEEKIVMVGGEPEIMKVKKKLPPDTGAATNWLKNRESDIWRDKVEVEHSGAIENKSTFKIVDKDGNELSPEVTAPKTKK